jgi:hypothetical protein
VDPIAQETGLPPKVLKYFIPVSNASAIFTPARGMLTTIGYFKG